MSRGYSVRRATKDDLDALRALLYEQKAKWFGNKRPKYEPNQIFRQYQTHRMVVELKDSDCGKLIGYAELRNYPAIGPLPSDKWLDWLHEKYCITLPLSWLNTLFFNFCIYLSAHPNALLALLDQAFYQEIRVEYLITVRAPAQAIKSYYAESFDDLEKVALVFYPREFSISSNPDTQSVYIVQRITLLPKITYRKAVPEDNDDIIEMHEHEFPELRAQLGDFYVAEELLRSDEEAKHTMIIVAEEEGAGKQINAAAFVWLEANVDIRFYIKNFEMEMFSNLLKFTPDKPYDFERMTVISVERKAEANLFTDDAMNDLDASTIIGGVQCSDSGISVASLSKLKVSSIQGAILNLNISTSQDKFYIREDLYLKFGYIFKKLVTIGYYITEESRALNLFYNTDPKNPDADGIQNSSNVFELKYICAHKDFPLQSLYGCLMAMFAAFPERDYCIMTIPKSANPLHSHMEALKYFTPVAQRSSEVTDLLDIYITHRSTIFGEIGLYRLENDDIEMVLEMARGGRTESELNSESPSSAISYSSTVNANINIDNELEVLHHIMSDVLLKQSTEYDAFTIRCGNSTKSAKENTIIGFVILRKFLKMNELHHHYHLPKNDQYLDNERAEIISLRLHPLFNNSCDVILRCLAAKTNYFDFYHISARDKLLFTNDLKTMMMAIEPNPMKKLMFNTVPKSKPVQKTIFTYMPKIDSYRDHMIVFRHKLNPTRWFGNSSKLVIIGFTPMSKAFLRQLLFQWNSKDHLNSENYTCLPRLTVTVITTPGLVEAEYDCMFDCPFCEEKGFCYLSYSNHSCYVRDVVVRMDLRLWVHFVSGYVISINRKRKFVNINNSCEVYYDTLLLMNYVNYSLKAEKLLDPSYRLPSNFIEINNRLDKFILFYKLKVLIETHSRSYLILIYGSNLQTYECIAFLLSHGVVADRIVLALPYRSVGTEEEQKLKNPFVDTNIQSVLDDMLDDLEVLIYRDLVFSHWVMHGSANFILEVVFTKFKSKKEIAFDCDIFISFQEGYMDPISRGWLTHSGIKLEGRRILVNKNFQTNDPTIYAAGKFIEFDDCLNHQYRYINERETAIKLMQILELRKFETPLDYKYAQPTFFRAQLPLDYFITKVIMPRRYLASHVTTCDNCSLTTHNEKTFCRIGLTRKMIVDEIVIVTQLKTSFDYLEHFCGKHEAMLNNLKGRYAGGLIKCFMKFLQEPWTELIMHEDFPDLQAANHQILKPMVENLVNTNTPIDVNLNEVNTQLLQKNLLDFIRNRRQDFHHEFALPEEYEI